MLEISARARAVAKRISRRTLLKVGALTAGGLTLADLLRYRSGAAPEIGSGARPSAKSIIQIWMGGGPSHLDMYDMKPEAPPEIRGEFASIATRVPGMRVCEHLPFQAAVMDRLAVVRSVCHSDSGHLPASQWMLTGYHVRNVTSDNAHPSHGSIVARVRGANQPGIPAYVGIPRKTSYGNAAYLGPAFNPFTTQADPAAPDFAVRDLGSPRRITARRLDDRRALLAGIDVIRRDLDANGQIAGFDRFDREALELITRDKAVRAFDLNRESPRLRDQYGRTTVGQGCLLARRLVEAGVSFVTVLSGGVWDTHANNFPLLKHNSLPKVDRAVAALVADLHQRGLDKNVLVMATGEFGRTPHINRNAGRDHWPGAMSMLFACGGLRVGQVIGGTDRYGAAPVARPLSPGDVAATLYHFMDIDVRTTFHDHSGRPFPVLHDGAPIDELISG